MWARSPRTDACCDGPFRLSRLSPHVVLCFEDAEEERLFGISCERDLLLPAGVVSAVACLVTAFFASFIYANEVVAGPSPFGMLSSRSFSFILWISMFLMSGVFAASCFVRLTCGTLACVPWERCFVSVASACSVCFVVTNRWHAPLLFGEDPDEMWEADPRHNVLHVPLLLDIGLTLVCLYVPVRTSVLWVLPASSTLMFAILQSALPKASESSWGDVLILTVLSFSALHGTFKSEKQRRDCWISVRKAKQAEIPAQQQSEVQAGHLQEIQTLKEELQNALSESFDVVLPLPGSLQQDNVPRRGRRASSQKMLPAASAASNSRDSAIVLQQDSPEDVQSTPSEPGPALDGFWVLRNGTPGVARWLRSLDIRGDRVLDGDGGVTYLKGREHGDVHLEGGRLIFDGNVLIREGKKSRFIFDRVERAV